MTPGHHKSKAEPATFKRLFRVCTYTNFCIMVEVWLILIVLLVAAFPGIRHEWQLSTTHQPERLTELYFPNSQSLPTTYVPGEKLTVHFAIHNLEYQDTTYPLQIVLGTSTSTVTAYRGEITLKQGQTATVNAPISIPQSGPRLAVNVLLTNKNQAIHFWLEKHA